MLARQRQAHILERVRDGRRRARRGPRPRAGRLRHDRAPRPRAARRAGPAREGPRRCDDGRAAAPCSSRLRHEVEPSAGGEGGDRGARRPASSSPGMAIALSAGTTTYAVARRLRRRAAAHGRHELRAASPTCCTTAAVPTRRSSSRAACARRRTRSSGRSPWPRCGPCTSTSSSSGVHGMDPHAGSPDPEHARSRDRPRPHRGRPAAWSSSPTTPSGASIGDQLDRAARPGRRAHHRRGPREPTLARCSERAARRLVVVGRRSPTTAPVDATRLTTALDGRGRCRASSQPSDPHRRYDPLLDDGCSCPPGRTRRPWHGADETAPPSNRRAYDPTCYLCPGNMRANGDANPEYGTTFVFTNDFAALQPGRAPTSRFEDGLLRAEGERGDVPRGVLLAAPRPDPRGMPAADVRSVIDLWAEQTDELGDATIAGSRSSRTGASAMGASNPHPHGQIWAGYCPARDGRARGRDPAARTWSPPVADCCSTTSPRSPAGRGSSTSEGLAGRSCRSGRPGHSRSWSSRSARPRV